HRHPLGRAVLLLLRDKRQPLVNEVVVLVLLRLLVGDTEEDLGTVEQLEEGGADFRRRRVVAARLLGTEPGGGKQQRGKQERSEAEHGVGPQSWCRARRRGDSRRSHWTRSNSLSQSWATSASRESPWWTMPTGQLGPTWSWAICRYLLRVR